MSLIYLLISFRLVELQLVFDANVLPFELDQVLIFGLLNYFSWYLYLEGFLLILSNILS